MGELTSNDRLNEQEKLIKILSENLETYQTAIQSQIIELTDHFLASIRPKIKEMIREELEK